MSITITTYKGMQILNPSPTGQGGILLINNLKEFADRIGPTHQSTAVPTTDNDGNDTAGLGIAFEIGSRWYRDTGTIYEEYVCLNNDTGAAQWVQTGSTSSGVTSVNGKSGVVVLDYEDVGAAAEDHSHAISDVTGLQDALDGKLSTSGISGIQSGDALVWDGSGYQRLPANTANGYVGVNGNNTIRIGSHSQSWTSQYSFSLGNNKKQEGYYNFQAGNNSQQISPGYSFQIADNSTQSGGGSFQMATSSNQGGVYSFQFGQELTQSGNTGVQMGRALNDGGHYNVYMFGVGPIPSSKTAATDNTFYIWLDNGLRLKPVSSPPTSPENGTIYYNSSNHQFLGYAGGEFSSFLQGPQNYVRQWKGLESKSDLATLPAVKGDQATVLTGNPKDPAHRYELMGDVTEVDENDYEDHGQPPGWPLVVRVTLPPAAGMGDHIDLNYDTATGQYLGANVTLYLEYSQLVVHPPTGAAEYGFTIADLPIDEFSFQYGTDAGEEWTDTSELTISVPLTTVNPSQILSNWRRIVALDADGEIKGPILNRLVLDTDDVDVARIGEIVCVVDDLDEPTTVSYRMGDGTTKTESLPEIATVTP